MEAVRPTVARPVTDEGSVEVEVRGIAAGGSGVGDLPDGRVVFVPRTAPGDRARIRIDKEKSRWALGTLRRVVEPGPDRREAPCPLYARCGGCQLQHLSYDKQLEWKGRFVADALRRVGRLGPVEPPEVVPSPTQLGYRNRVTFTLRRLRAGRVVAGFHALGRPTHVVDVRGECLLPEPALMDAWKRLRGAWGSGAHRLPQGGRLRLTLRSTGSGVELVIEGGGEDWNAEGLLSRATGLAVVRHRPKPGGPVRLVHGSAEEGLGTAFVQVNRAVAAALSEHVAEVAGAGERAVDAYCGVGVLGRALAERGWSVVGIEADASAVRAARRTASGFEPVHGRVEELLGAHLPTELLVVNPPRAGLGSDVVETVLAAPPERMIYVSCDPATLARDVGALAPRFRLDGLRSFDLFPQTAHVETVAHLVRSEEAP